MMQIDVSEEEENKVLQDSFENFPECAECLRCTKWDYKNFVFDFYDEDTDKTHTVTLEDARKGLREYIKQVLLGKTSLEGNPNNWDAWNYDAIMQCSIFGDIIYG